MSLLLNTYKKNVGKKELFDKIIDIDFYDGPTEAICKLDSVDKWFVCSLCYFDVEKRERIFTIIEIQNGWLIKINILLAELGKNNYMNYRKIKSKIKSLYKNYKGDLFLFKSDSLRSRKYEVAEMPVMNLKYFKELENIFSQGEESQLKWIDAFKKNI